MAGTNGHAPELEPVDGTPTASAAELDALLQGLFEPVRYELAPGRSLEVRPIKLDRADKLYSGTLRGGELQTFLLARCVFIEGKQLGDELARNLPIALANRLVPLVMSVNGMDWTPPGGEGEGGGETDPKA
jgi:hypothetical protein